MTDTNVSSLVLKKGSNRYIFDPSGNLDLSNYYTKSEIDTKFNSYALKTEVPDTSNLATKTELNSVKSTATTANNTANSAKTTAQNALNTANSKLSVSFNKSNNPMTADWQNYEKRTTRFTDNNNLLINCIRRWNISNNDSLPGNISINGQVISKYALSPQNFSGLTLLYGKNQVFSSPEEIVFSTLQF